MKFCLVVHSAPHSRQGSRSALLFARAVLDAGHQIYRVFFYGDGIANASQLAVVPQDEQDLAAEWQQLIEQNQLDAVVCIAASLKRGVVDATEAGRYGKTASNLRPGFELSGLGQLVDAAATCDRVITFGD